MDVDKRPKSGLDLAVMMLLEFQGQLKIARTVIEAVAENHLAYSHEAGNHCLFCDADDHGHVMEVYHKDDCPILVAQRWLADNPA